jgi:hypothetical protein
MDSDVGEHNDNELRDLELKTFQDAVGAESDPTMLILRSHLFTENLLERLIRLSLPRGDKVIEAASLSYAQKLVLVEALEELPDAVASSLRGLNKLRNQCAHQLGRTVSDADVVRIGSPLGASFTQFHREAKYDPIVTLRKVASYVAGYITGVCHVSEEKNVAKETLRSLNAKPAETSATSHPMSSPSIEGTRSDRPGQASHVKR